MEPRNLPSSEMSTPRSFVAAVGLGSVLEDVARGGGENSFSTPFFVVFLSTSPSPNPTTYPVWRATEPFEFTRVTWPALWDGKSPQPLLLARRAVASTWGWGEGDESLAFVSILGLRSGGTLDGGLAGVSCTLPVTSLYTTPSTTDPPRKHPDEHLDKFLSI